MKEILIITSRKPRRDDALAMLREACAAAVGRLGQEVRIESAVDIRNALGNMQQHISTADIVVADASGSRQDVIYELGFAHGRDKPTILVSDEEAKPTL